MNTNQSPLQTSTRLARGISFQEKLAILHHLEAGVARKDICSKFKICQSTISRILVTKAAIVELAEQNKNLARTRVAMVTYKDIDEALSKWAQQRKRDNEAITASLAKQKAVEIARAMGQEDFKPSTGWLYKWKERENVQFFKKPKLLEQLIPTKGKEDILKGLLEQKRNGSDSSAHEANRLNATDQFQTPEAQNSSLENSFYDHQAEDMDTPKSEQTHLHPVALSHSLEDSDVHIPQANSISPETSATDLNIHNESPIRIPMHKVRPYNTSQVSPPAGGSFSAPPTPKSRKVLYSYDPVYVLTSTGRYRKEKTFLTLLQKLEILQRLKNGERRTNLINEYRLSQSAMCQIIADEKKIQKMAAIGQNLQMKRIRGGIFKAGETELNAWVLQRMDNGNVITRNEVKNKAKEIAQRMKIEFKASTGWLEKWKARMNLDFNEKHILYRKPPQYPNAPGLPELLEAQHAMQHPAIPYIDMPHSSPDNVYNRSVQQLIDLKNQHDESEDFSTNYTGDDSSMDIKPYMDSQQFYPEVITIAEDDEQNEPEDVKPYAQSPPHILPDQDSSDECEESLHQQILGWLNKYNIAPTAATELLTILHPVISDKPDAPHQTRLTITTKPPSRSKGRPYAQHTYS